MKKFGVEFPAGTSMLEAHLWCMRHDKRGDYQGGRLSTFDHFKGAVDIIFNYPESTRRFIWNPWAEKMLKEALQCPDKKTRGAREEKEAREGKAKTAVAVDGVKRTYNRPKDKFFLGIAGSSSAGKCLGPEVEVLMFDGTKKKAKDIKVGDQLMGPDSSPRNVLSLHSGRDQMYRIRQDNGEEWTCNSRHELTLKRVIAGPKSKRKLGEIEDIELKDYLSSSKTFKNQRRMFSSGVEFPDKKVPVDPRLYGIWIGDGNSREPIITVSDKEVEILEYINDVCKRDGYKLSKYDYENQACPSYRIYKKPEKDAKGRIPPKFSQGSKLGKLVKDSWEKEKGKRIRAEYLRNSRRKRLELLAGIIDADGHAAKGGRYYEIACKNTGLKDDITYLAQSLGFRVRSVLRSVNCNGTECKSWRINICGDVNEIPALRKKGKKKKRRTDNIRFEVEPIGEGEYYGFRVDGDHRFLLGNFTVTHNSDVFGLLCIILYLSAPTETLCLCTSTTIEMAKLRIWKAVKEYWTQVEQFFLKNRISVPGKAVHSKCVIRGLDTSGELSDYTGIRLIPADKQKGEEATSKLMGAKAPGKGLLVLAADELPDLAQNVLTVAFTNLINNPRFWMYGLGNPDLILDSFGRFCEPKDGWGILKSDPDEWDTERGRVIRLNAEKNPNLERTDNRFFWMPTQAVMDAAAKQFGRNSRKYCRMFRATWALEKDPNAIFSEQELLKAGPCDEPRWDNIHEVKLLSGMDSSFTSGGDRSVEHIGKIGKVNGKPVLWVDHFRVIDIDDGRDMSPSHQVALNWIRGCKERGIRPQAAGFDNTGAGISFGHIVDMEWSTSVRKISFGGKPSGRKYVIEGETDLEYQNRVSELWVQLKPLIRQGQLVGVPLETIEELIMREYDQAYSGAKLKIESKQKLKGRLGKSCDLADSLVILCEVALLNGWLDSVEQKNILKRAKSSWEHTKAKRRYKASKRKTPHLKF